MHPRPNEIALWRYQVIAPLLMPSNRTLKSRIEELAGLTHDHPERGRIELKFGTIEEWYYAYKKGGLEGLVPAGRSDRGRSRSIDDEVAGLIEDLVERVEGIDGPTVIKELGALVEQSRVPSLSSLYRHLEACGLDLRKSVASRDHRRYGFDLAGDCWQADVMYGPSIPAIDGGRRRTYLFAILDDATRLIVHAEFYLEQHLRCLKDCLKQGLLKRGIPNRFYVDNGKIFRSRLLLAIGARLGMHIIHSRPYRPQGRAKIERWFRTVRRSFLVRLDTDRVEDVAALNRLLFAWIEGEYHVRGHRGLEGETPLDRWIRLSDGVRPIPPETDLDWLFLDETTRRVGKDGTFSLKGKLFEAGPEFIGRRIDVFFDPFDLRRVYIACDGGPVTEAFPVDIRANRRARRREGPATDRRPGAYDFRSLDELADRIDREANLDDEDDATDQETDDGEV